MDIDLSGKVFFIDGGSRGLGRATAQALIGEGARAVLVARDQAGLDVAAEQLGAVDVETVAADLADPAAPVIAVAAAHRRFGRPDGALINTGGPATGAADELDDGSWADAVRATFLAPIRLARVEADDLRKHAGGAIAFVLSTSVRAPLTSLALSNAIRPGLAGHVKNLADAASLSAEDGNGDGAFYRWLDEAGRLIARARVEFRGPAGEWFDSGPAAGRAAFATTLWRHGRITGEPQQRQEAIELVEMLLGAGLDAVEAGTALALAEAIMAPRIEAHTPRAGLLQRLAWTDPHPGALALAGDTPLAEGRNPEHAYVCHGRLGSTPTTDPEHFAQLLKAS